MTDEIFEDAIRYFDANRHRLAYHVYGEGDLVVAIPGGPGFSHTYLRMPQLERRARLIYLDNLGTGRSDRLADPAGYSRAVDVSNLEALRQHLNLDRLTLLGHSAGGFIVQEYALSYPEHVERMVLYATTPTNGVAFDESLDLELGDRSKESRYASAIRAFAEVFSSPLSQDKVNVILGEAFKLFLFDFEESPDVLQNLTQKADLDVVRMKRGTVVNFDYRSRLTALDIPTLVVTGVKDFICAPRLAAMIRDCIPGSRLVIMERSGHFAHLEDPERFAETVSSFLAQ